MVIFILPLHSTHSIQRRETSLWRKKIKKILLFSLATAPFTLFLPKPSIPWKIELNYLTDELGKGNWECVARDFLGSFLQNDLILLCPLVNSLPLEGKPTVQLSLGWQESWFVQGHGRGRNASMPIWLSLLISSICNIAANLTSS